MQLKKCKKKDQESGTKILDVQSMLLKKYLQQKLHSIYLPKVRTSIKKMKISIYRSINSMYSLLLLLYPTHVLQMDHLK